MQNQEELLFQKLAESQKSGYLNENFLLFHLRDKKEQSFSFHYHDFHKIIIFLSGSVTYLIEGKAYDLKPWDILLIGRHNIHKPLIQPDHLYDRIVIWISNDFITSQKTAESDLSACFTHTQQQGVHLIRPDIETQLNIRELLFQLETALSSSEFASSILSAALFLQLLVQLNRTVLNPGAMKKTASLKYDKQIEEILLYINHNLNTDLSIEQLSGKFFLSRSYLMHKFKKETGYTLHRYIEQKRLIHAAADISQGIPVMKAALSSGFSDYSTFLRAFRKHYGMSPKEYANRKRPSELQTGIPAVPQEFS